jgi:hypothetical protein
MQEAWGAALLKKVEIGSRRLEHLSVGLTAAPNGWRQAKQPFRLNLCLRCKRGAAGSSPATPNLSEVYRRAHRLDHGYELITEPGMFPYSLPKRILRVELAFNCS